MINNTITEEHCNKFRTDFIALINAYRRQEELTAFKAKWDGKVNFQKTSNEMSIIVIAGENQLPGKLKYNIAGMRNRFREGRYN